MYSHTIAALEKFDNQHDFERMAADILNALGYTEVLPIAPRGGSDRGKDIRFTTVSGGKGLACVTLREDIQRKFEEDFSKRQAGEYEKYVLFCTAHLTAQQKQKFNKYCVNNLKAELVVYDIEALRSLLDSTILPIREKYLHISSGNEHVNVPVSSSSTRTKVFISYSHKDARYLHQLVEHLAYYERNNLIEFWSDEKIAAGAQWREEIKQAIEATKVAVLLISPSTSSPCEMEPVKRLGRPML